MHKKLASHWAMLVVKTCKLKRNLLNVKGKKKREKNSNLMRREYTNV